MAQNPSEKLLLGAQMSKEFLGEDLLSNLRNNAVSYQKLRNIEKIIAHII